MSESTIQYAARVQYKTGKSIVNYIYNWKNKTIAIVLRVNFFLYLPLFISKFTGLRFLIYIYI